MSNTQLSIRKRKRIIAYLGLWEAEEVEILKTAKDKFDIQEELARNLIVKIKSRYGWIRGQLEQ